MLFNGLTMALASRQCCLSKLGETRLSLSRHASSVRQIKGSRRAAVIRCVAVTRRTGCAALQQQHGWGSHQGLIAFPAATFVQALFSSVANLLLSVSQPSSQAGTNPKCPVNHTTQTLFTVVLHSAALLYHTIAGTAIKRIQIRSQRRLMQPQGGGVHLHHHHHLLLRRRCVCQVLHPMTPPHFNHPGAAGQGHNCMRTVEGFY